MKTKIEFQRNNLTIRGHLWGEAEPGKHAVILSHGFLVNETICHKYAMLMEDLGFFAVTYDFCGGSIHGESDGATQDMTIFTEKEDLLAVIKGVEKRFSPKRITLLGCSQGGLVSALAAKDRRDIVERLILLYPALCIPDDARKGMMTDYYRFDPGNIPDILGTEPITIGGDYARTLIDKDVFEMILGFNGPVLYLHGTEDKIVDIRYARKAKDCYPDCEYHELVGARHMFKGKSDKEACERIASFMKNI